MRYQNNDMRNNDKRGAKRLNNDNKIREFFKKKTTHITSIGRSLIKLLVYRFRGIT